ncbi:hypothetical protein BD779DRAFT_1476166 [Infundibulicybe gibba]|nr:hypothetical protein BD779DRAFT_1476166 [Infundibulicybe gibba]
MFPGVGSALSLGVSKVQSKALQDRIVQHKRTEIAVQCSSLKSRGFIETCWWCCEQLGPIIEKYGLGIFARHLEQYGGQLHREASIPGSPGHVDRVGQTDCDTGSDIRVHNLDAWCMARPTNVPPAAVQMDGCSARYE